MNSEEVARRRQKVKGQKAATSALSQLGLMASTTNQPKRLRSRSGSYDAVSPLGSIRWRCDACGLCGIDVS